MIYNTYKYVPIISVQTILIPKKIYQNQQDTIRKIPLLDRKINFPFLFEFFVSTYACSTVNIFTIQRATFVINSISIVIVIG